MKKITLPLFVLCGIIGYAQEKEMEIKKVTITKNITQPTKRIDDKLYTGTEITKKGIQSLGTIANSNIFTIVNVIPSVTVNTTNGTEQDSSGAQRSVQ